MIFCAVKCVRYYFVNIAFTNKKSVYLCLLLTGTSFADTIQPLSSEKYIVEGKNVTLSCNYSTSGTVNSLQWYRQYVGAKPKFLLFVDEYSSKFKTDLRLYSKATKEIKRVDLVIFSAAVSDSALYYCALRPTVTGNTRTLYKKLIHYIEYTQNSPSNKK
uniref:Ig-like domain-containing protein n=1 Tax=Cyprinus carpio TaxID=7962 RepID=A0A8C1N6Y3_CYPCA